VRKFAESTYQRMRNPAKVYLVDTGLCRRVTSADTGRLLENIVFLELKRRGYEVFYFEEERECDFIARTDEDGLLPMQVCYELNEENMEREIGGLIQACRWLNINDGTILTYGDEKDLSRDEINIEVQPVWKWLLQHRFPQ
jgi:predicted AAA+ superfamily ATPase